MTEHRKSGPPETVSVDAIRRLAAKGMTAAEIADAMRCSKSRVHTKARDHGIALTHGISGNGRAAVDTSAKPAPDAPVPSKPRPGSMAEYAARENKAMRMVGRR